MQRVIGDVRMLIRSQDKTVLTNFANATDIMIDCIEEKKIEIIAILTRSRTKTKLGEYSTEEKAIKVLNMIENFYSNIEYTKFMGCGREKIASYIFQMPQDSEV